jgi:hypothetical protein
MMKKVNIEIKNMLYLNKPFIPCFAYNHFSTNIDDPNIMDKIRFCQFSPYIPLNTNASPTK